MKWKIKGVITLIVLFASLQSCSRTSCKGGSCPVFSETELEIDNPQIEERKAYSFVRA